MLTDVTAPVAPAAPVTTAAFEAFIARPENSERRFELIDGEIVEKAMPTFLHANIAGRFVQFLNNFFDEHPEIVAFSGVEPRHRPTGDEQNDRLPDVAVVLHAVEFKDRGVEDYIPDICIEIQSPDERLTKMREKMRFYLANGAKAALIVRPDKRTIEVYTPDDEIVILSASDALTFPDLLPGFSVLVAKLFPPAP